MPPARIKTQKQGFTTQKIRTQSSARPARFFAVLLANLVGNVRDSKSLQRSVLIKYAYDRNIL